VTAHEAKTGSVVVLDTVTGEVLALYQLPKLCAGQAPQPHSSFAAGRYWIPSGRLHHDRSVAHGA
jgi:hypothetical protein